MCQAIHNMINVCIAVKKYSEGGGGYFLKEIHIPLIFEIEVKTSICLIYHLKGWDNND